MVRRSWFTLGLLAAAVAFGVQSLADPPVVRGQFTDRVENNRPVGDVASLASARQIVYFIELDNHDAHEITLTLVWRIDGHETYRQHIVTHGHATWAFYPRSHVHTVAVSVLDASGHEVHTDQATLPSASGT